MKSRRIDRLSGSLVREILAVTQRPDVVSFAGGLPAAEAMPEIRFDGAPDGLRQYGPSEGEPQLRELIAQRLCALGRVCTAGQVLVTSGSQQGIDLVAKLFIDEGTTVALESPTYLAALQAFRLFGADFMTLELSPDGPDPEALRVALVRRRPGFVYLIPNFQNPSGACYPLERRRAIAAVLEEQRVPLVEDDPYHDLAYDTVVRTPVTAFLEETPWVYLGSFSKTLCPGLRIGYLACSPSLFPYLARLKQAADLHTDRMGQWWVARFIAGQEYAGHIARLQSHYRARRDAMHAALGRHFRGLADWSLPAGGLFFWLRLRQGRETLPLLKRALARDVAFMPGEPFFPHAESRYGALRLNLSHPSPGKIERGVEILAEVIRDSAAVPTSDSAGSKTSTARSARSA